MPLAALFSIGKPESSYYLRHFDEEVGPEDYFYTGDVLGIFTTGMSTCLATVLIGLTAQGMEQDAIAIKVHTTKPPNEQSMVIKMGERRPVPGYIDITVGVSEVHKL